MKKWNKITISFFIVLFIYFIFILIKISQIGLLLIYSSILFFIIWLIFGINNKQWKIFIFDLIAMCAASITVLFLFALNESAKWHHVGTVMHHLVKENEKGNKELVNEILIRYNNKRKEGKESPRAFYEVVQDIQEFELYSLTEDEIQIKSRYNLNKIKSDVDSLEKENNTRIDNLIKKESEILGLDNKESFIILLKNKEYIYYKENNLNKKVFNKNFDKEYRRDGWGTPLNLDYTTNLTGLSESLSNSLNKCSIAVWSSGPNKIDERCLGDDIPWTASYLDYTPYYIH